MQLYSQLRHLTTGLTTVGAMLLLGGLIRRDEVAAADAAWQALAEPLTVLGGLVAGGLLRLAMGWVGRKFSSPGTGDEEAGRR